MKEKICKTYIHSVINLIKNGYVHKNVNITYTMIVYTFSLEDLKIVLEDFLIRKLYELQLIGTKII